MDELGLDRGGRESGGFGGHHEAAHPSSVWAQMTATLATEARPIQRLEPLRTQSSPSRRAVVRMLAGSLPRWAR